MLVLAVQPNGTYVDGTLGGATHTSELLQRCAPNGRVYSFDVDPVAIERAREKLKSVGARWQPIEANFRHIAEELEALHIGPVDGVLLDLGLSSDELADPTKGISFMQEGPLDMRLGPKANDDGLTATEIVNTWNFAELVELINVFGEERYAASIAKHIIAARRVEPIVKTSQLSAVIVGAVPANYERGRIHPATRTFQALRIAVNDEVQALKQVIASAHACLKPGGRLAIISFHSIEDRIVKEAFKDESKWEVITKKPIEASEAEVEVNPRSRSAKLRAATKL